MCIKSDAKNGQQYQKWLFATSEILSKIGSIFLLKARVLYLTIFKRKNLSLLLKVETDQFVIRLVLPVSFCQNLLHFTLGQANRDGADAESPFPLFFSLFFASFKNSSPRGKVGKLSSFWDRWAESLFVSIIVAKYNIFPRANNDRSREKKFLAKRFAQGYQRALSGF